jgi:hypothetical protein
VFQNSLPNLRIIPLKTLILHEEHDNQCVLPLVEILRAQGILRNPPIVMPLTDGSSRYILLDGANRVTSLKEMEFPHIVVQVVEPDDPNVSLRTWKHVVWGMSVRTLPNGLRRVAGLELNKININRSMEAPDRAPVQIRLPDGKVFLGRTPVDIFKHVRVL